MKGALQLKIRRKLWAKVVQFFRKKSLYPYLYRSYWHCHFHKNKQAQGGHQYLAARPNPGAGIGHQMANWIAGYWWAQQFHLKFAHIPFSKSNWEDFLGFGQDEVTVGELLLQGYKKRRLPLFEERNKKEVARTQKIISSYAGQKVVFLCEQDQFYRDQYGVMVAIQQKFHSAPLRAQEKLIFNQDHYNVAIHVRRGDIMADPNNPNLQMRYIPNEYFITVLQQVLEKVQSERPKHVYFFSQGKPEDYPEFHGIKNLHWCLDMGAQESFLHMVHADMLITSKSSFSYKPALLNKNLKVCPQNFWHGYPNSKDWVLVNENVTNLNLFGISEQVR